MRWRRSICKLDAVYTNMVPVTPIRGAGRPDACFVMERLADKVAHELKLAAAEVRRRSFVTSGQMPYMTGLKGRDGKTPIAYDSGDYAACLDMALSHVQDFRAATGSGARCKAAISGSGFRSAWRTPASAPTKARRSASTSTAG